MTFPTRLTRRKIHKSWDSDAQELRLVLRLPPGHRFSGMQVSCSRVTVEYFQTTEPNIILSDTLELYVPVRGDEAIHALREEPVGQILSLWIPRHTPSLPGQDLMARQPAATTLAPCLVAS